MVKPTWIALVIGLSNVVTIAHTAVGAWLPPLSPTSNVSEILPPGLISQAGSPPPSPLPSPPPVQRTRSPRQRLGTRGGLCAISPGLLEQENVIWSDRPLFLWQADSHDIDVQQLELTDAEGRILWEKSLDTTTASVIYDGQPLQPGQFYTWRLEWTVQDRDNSMDYTFQIMEAEQRNQIASDLQTLTNQSQNSNTHSESIADRQARYFIDNSPWSDALQVLYMNPNLSVETTQEIRNWIDAACDGSR